MRVEPIERSAGAQAGGETEEAVFRRQQALAPTLRATSAAQRLAKLDRLGRSLRPHRAEIQQAAAADFSKPPEEVELGEIFPVLHEIAQAKRHLNRWMKPKRVASTLAMFGTKALPFNHVFFTGSRAVGRIVMKAAAEQLASVTLELGGKSPAIADESADLDRTIRNPVGTKFTNQGQSCIAPDYVYVHEQVRDAFLDRLKARVEAVFGVDEQAQRANSDFARSVNDRHFDRVKALLDDALARGARIVAGGAPRADERFIAPTVLADVAPGSRILDEEICGNEGWSYDEVLPA